MYKNLVKRTSSRVYQKRFLALPALVLSLLVLLSACSTSATAPSQGSAASGTSPSPTPTVAIQPTSSGQQTPSSTSDIKVKVYFSKTATTYEHPEQVYPVLRTSPDTKVGTFAIEQLIAGPTDQEKSAGYLSVLHDSLTSSTNCSADFTLTLDKKGTVDQPGTATLQFCRQITSSGVGQDARIRSEIIATLTQFPTIKKVVILNNAGHCFGDMSGADMCLN